MSSIPELCLYNTTIQSTQTSIATIAGQFSGSKSQEIIIASSSSLLVYKPDKETGKLQLILEAPVFAIIRSIVNFKIAGTGKDYIALTSDSGNLSLLELDLPNRRFVSLFNEPYSKSGIRRLSPGEDLCVDSKGRALFSTAIERNKLLYVVNRDLENNLTVASPLEANRSKILTVTTIGLDVGYENPQFASIEIDYSEYEDTDDVDYKRLLTYYELDLGLNHVLKKHEEEIPSTSNLLLPVPGGNDGPSGVIVCSRGIISYRNLQGDKLSIAIPTTVQDQNKETYIVAGVTHKIKNVFFFLVQTNHKDLFKITLPHDKTLTISYFDTLPSIATSFIVLKSGYLYADSEYGDKYFFQFESLGPDTPQFISATEDVSSVEHSLFERQELTNLLLTDVLDTLNPLLSTSVTPTGQMLALAGLNTQSSFKTIDRGVKVNEIVESEIPGVADMIFTTKLSKSDQFDKYLILTFLNSTLVLEIGESVEEVTDSGLELNEPTLGVQQIGDVSLLQILPSRMISFKYGKQTSEWFPPGGIKITHCATNNRQVLIGLSSDEVVYFEVDEYERLIEFQTHYESSSKISCVSVGDIAEGRLRSQFMAVGTEDSLVRIFSCDPDSTLEQLSLQVVPDVPSSVLIISNANGDQFINIGLRNGLFVRNELNSRTGEVIASSQRVKYLGSKPVSLSSSFVNGEKHVLAISTTPWIASSMSTNLQITPLLTDKLNSACSLTNENFTNGVVSVYAKTLKIFELQNTDIESPLQIQSLELKDTAREIITYGDEVLVIGYSYVYGFEKGSGEISKSLELQESVKCQAAAVVKFAGDKGTFLCLSITDLKTNDHYIYSVKLETLEIVHKTKLSGVCLCMTEFEQKLLSTVSNELRLFDIGLKQLISKSSSRVHTLSQIVKIENLEYKGRVMVGDIRQSLTYLKYFSELNEFIPFADDTVSRHITTFKSLDHDTAIGGDKMGNLFVLRLDHETSKLIDTSSSTSFAQNPTKSLNGAKHKLNNLVNFFIQDIPLSFHIAPLTPGGQNVILYSCLQGTIGTLIPLVTKSDILFFTNLQKSMRLHYRDLTGRINLKYRGFYQPVKNCIDGDLVELFDQLNEDLQSAVAKDCGKSVEEIKRKIFEVKAGSI